MSKVVAELEARIRSRRLWLEYDVISEAPGKVYPWAAEFHDNGVDHPERLAISANQIGKCVTYQTLISTPQGEVSVGKLYECRESFDVLSWNGERVVRARASPPFKKEGRHECYRLILPKGWVECADEHRVLLGRSFVHVRDLLGYLPNLQGSIWDTCRSTHAEDDRRSSQKQQDFQSDCLPEYRLCDAQLHGASGAARGGFPSINGALRHIAPLSHSGVRGHKYTNIFQPFFDRLSILGDFHRDAGQWIESLIQVACRPGLPSHAIPQGFPPPSIVGFSELQSDQVAWPQGRPCVSRGMAPSDKILMSVNDIIGYIPIGPQEVYDFSVSKYHNYIAGNLVHHNTRTAGAETAIHLTGEYPNWWKGKRFDGPVRWWTGAQNSTDSKTIVQLMLLGPEGDHGTGWIPGSRIEKVTYRQAGITEMADTVYVRHKSGGLSTCSFKTYEQEAKGWRGASIHGIWFDEEPKIDIYSEGQTRVLAERGIILMSFTPLLGPTEVVRHFLDGGPGIYVKNVSWDDAPHLSEEEKERLRGSYPEWEVEARTKGTPLLGTGAIYPVSDESISVVPFEIPNHFRRLNGLDFGLDHPTAGVFMAIDPDDGTCIIYDCFKEKGQTPVYHSHSLKKHGEWIPTAWPHDGLQRDKGTGRRLKDLYREHGVYMLKGHAKRNQDDKEAQKVGPGVTEIAEYMRTGRFKVFSTLSNWFEEKRLYHTVDAKIVKKYDDLMDATRYAFVMRRFARTKPSGTVLKKKFSRPILGKR